jgi:hypothetical protein
MPVRFYWATTHSASCWSEIECSGVRTHGRDDLGVIDIRLTA